MIISKENAPDITPNRTIGFLVSAAFIFVFILVIFSFSLIQQLISRQEKISDSGMANAERLAYLAHEQQILSSSSPLPDGHYRIPIAQAMALIIKQQGEIN